MGGTNPIDLPAEVADVVYTGHATDGRAIAYVRDGQLFVADHNHGIVFALEYAHGDTPPLVYAIADELTEESLSRGTAKAVALTTAHGDQPAPGVSLLRALP